MVSTSSKPSCLRGKELYFIRRQLTEDAVRAADKRARFVGMEAYEAAGGIVMRDLMAAGCRIPRCSTGSLARSSPSRPKRSEPRAGNGSRPPSISRAGTISFRLPQFLLDIRHETPVVHAAR